MKITLHRQDYEKYKNLLLPQYLIWDAKKNAFVETKQKGFSFEIVNVKKISDKKKEELKTVLDSWKLQIENEEIKPYSHYMDANDCKELYCGIADIIHSYLFTLEEITTTEDTNKTKDQSKQEYFSYISKNQSTYLNIGILSMSKDKKDASATLECSLSYAESQSIRAKRKNGTFGACGHNFIAESINYIFSHKNINRIYTIPDNYASGKALEKLGFK